LSENAFVALIAEYLTDQLVVVKKNAELSTFVTFHLSLHNKVDDLIV